MNYDPLPGFLNAQNVSPREIHRSIFEVHGKGTMNDWFEELVGIFKEGRAKVHDKERSSHPPLTTDYLISSWHISAYNLMNEIL